MCVSQPVTYECNSGSSSLTWIVLDANGDRVGTPVPYNEFSSVGDPGSIGGQFNTVLIVGGSSLVSNITFTPILSISNYTVQCGAAGTLVNCSIVTEGMSSIDNHCTILTISLQIFQLLLFLAISHFILTGSPSPGPHQPVLVYLITMLMLLVLNTLLILV